MGAPPTVDDETGVDSVARVRRSAHHVGSLRVLQVIGVLVAFALVGWGIGALVTSALTASDLDAVRDVASARTAPATVAAHVFSWVGSGFVIFPLALVSCLMMYRKGRRRSALAVALSTIGVQVIIALDKLLVGRARPPVRHLDHVVGHSFPSGHTSQTAALCAVLLIEGSASLSSRRLRFTALVGSVLLIACVAFSRVYLGVHYPSDVVAGAVLGVSWSLAASRLSHLWNARRNAPTPTIRGGSIHESSEDSG